MDVSKGDISFAPAKHIPRLMEGFEKGPLSRDTPCNFKSADRAIKALAEVHIELVLIHPFLRGNGRVARIIATLMTLQAGLPMLDFRDITCDKANEYFSAIQKGLNRDFKPMEHIFSQVLLRSLKAKPDENV